MIHHEASRIPTVVFSIVLAASAASFTEGVIAAEGDWPQWRGPHRDGISRETGLPAVWPADGPPLLWRRPLGEGFSAVSVVGDKAYTMYAGEQGEFALCLDVADGRTIWEVPSGERFENGYGNGPRATPTVDGERVYTHGATGTLLCLDAASGSQLWGFNVLEKFGAENLEFGMSASPLVLGEKLIVVVGAGHQAETSSPQSGRSLVALNKRTGGAIWTSLSDKGGYSTPLPIEVDGMPQIAVLTGEAILGVASEDGRELWRHPWITTLDANVATPIYHAGRLFVSSGYGTGCALFKLFGEDAAEQLWANKDMKNYFSTSLLIDGYLYGFNNTMLACMDFETGEVRWVERGFNRGSLLAADGKLIILGERGTLALAEVSSDEYKEISRVEIFHDKAWTVPTLAHGKLFLRNEQELLCLSLRR